MVIDNLSVDFHQKMFEKKRMTESSLMCPLLCNVYMHALDKKVLDLKKISCIVQKLYKNKNPDSTYRKLEQDFAVRNFKDSLKKFGTKEKVFKVKKQSYKINHEKYGRTKRMDNIVRHLQYVRYANDFLIGIVSSYKYAIQIHFFLNNFITSNLHLNIKKNIIVHRNHGNVQFLGHLIGLPKFKEKPSTTLKALRAAKNHKINSLARFLITDNRLATAKSYQFQANIIKQIKLMAEKMKLSISQQKNINNISCVIAYKELGKSLTKELELKNLKQFFDIIQQIDMENNSSKKRENKALNR